MPSLLQFIFILIMIVNFYSINLLLTHPYVNVALIFYFTVPLMNIEKLGVQVGMHWLVTSHCIYFATGFFTAIKFTVHIHKLNNV